MTGSTRSVESSGVSAAWVEAVEAILACRQRQAFHFFVRMLEPLPEIAAVRRAADELMESIGRRPIDSVRNTVFPFDWAQDIPNPSDLSRDYLEHYDDLKGLESPRGTYFGRIISPPRADDSEGNQLVRTIEKLKSASGGGNRWKSRYEINIYNEQKDWKITRSFPCMSHLAFQVDGEELHCLATYRNHDLIEKSYGNWLALAQLQQYVAAASGFVPGELSVLAGHAFVELSGPHLTELRRTLEHAHELVAE